MKKRKSTARLARRIKDFDETMKRLGPVAARAYKRPGSQKKS
jgi:hypothetical protein